MSAPNLEDLDRQISETRKAFFEARGKLVQLAHPRNPDPDGAADGLIADAAERGLARTLDSVLREPVLHGLDDSTPADQLTSSLGAAYAADQALDLLMRDRNAEFLRFDPFYKPRMNLFGRDVELDYVTNRARDLESAETYALPDPDATKRRRREKSK
ncbi:MAG: hypothetical protein R3D33_02955 [Hyphomicrobiaceae bacterium]